MIANPTAVKIAKLLGACLLCIAAIYLMVTFIQWIMAG